MWQEILKSLAERLFAVLCLCIGIINTSCAQKTSTTSDTIKEVFSPGKADHARFNEDSSMLMWGHVRMSLNNDRLFSDTALWQTDGTIVLSGNVKVVTPNGIAQYTDKLKIDFNNFNETTGFVNPPSKQQ